MSGVGPLAKVRVLVVEDSPTVRDLLVHLLSSDPQMIVVGTAATGEEAIAAAKERKPDVITMDVHMPGMNGLDATRRIMETHPTPIVIVSGSIMRDEVAATFRALDAGALAFVQKPSGLHQAEAVRQLLYTVKLMSEVKVVRRWPKPRSHLVDTTDSRPFRASELKDSHAEAELVAIGASTGGPIVLKAILSELPKHFPLPILLVQHIAPGFTEGFAEWLANSTGFGVRVATHHEPLRAGCAYVAPDGVHMTVERGGKIALRADEPEDGHRPSVSRLFRSVAQVSGRNAIGVLLTGMGRDGAEGLKLMRDRGAVTIAQSPSSSVIHGMPGAAIGLDAATYVLSPEGIAAALGSLTR